jgi:hypothetical protein
MQTAVYHPTSTRPRASGSVAARAPRSRATATRGILDTALLAEQVATAFYYRALTTPAILRTPQLAGRSDDPNDPGLPPQGDPHHVRYLQAALDAEAKHMALLHGAGARAQVRRVYFSADAFQQLGTSLQPQSFLGALDRLETESVGLYLAAVDELARLGQLDLAQLAAQLGAVEAEHRMLGRVIAGITPANNLTLEREPFANVDAAQAALRPYLTGKGLHGRAHTVAVPTGAQIARVVGKYGTHRVQRYM